MTTLQYEKTALGALYWRLGTGDTPLTDWVKADSIKQLQTKAKREGLTLEEYKARADTAPTVEEPKKRVAKPKAKRVTTDEIFENPGAWMSPKAKPAAKKAPPAKRAAKPKVEAKPVQESEPIRKNTHDVREAWLNAFIARARPVFKGHGFPIGENVRASIGFTSGGTRGKRIGECWDHTATPDGVFEIFLRPSLETDARIADVLTHELCHAAVGLEAKHGKRFKQCAESVGLEGKMTATVAGDKWREWADPVLEALGPMPGAPLSEAGSNGKKKQTTRLIKGECMSCGLTMRITDKWIRDEMRCPDAECDGQMVFG